PPKVLLTPYPWSSVRMSSTLGAPFGGTTRGGHHVFESLTSSLITPPNFGSGAGIWLPLIVVVALGAPEVPVTTCPAAGATASRNGISNVVTITRMPGMLSARFILGSPPLGSGRSLAAQAGPPVE